MAQEIKQFQYTEDGHLKLMKPEERELLIRDLTSRIEYGVICMIERVDDFGSRWRDEQLTGFCKLEKGCFYFEFSYGLDVEFAEHVSPYLRTMSSMTEEELYEWTHTWIMDTTAEKYDWLNAHHFDYRGLIPMGLAIAAPEEMYENVLKNV